VTVFIDTSAFFAILDADDQNHSAAGSIWKTLLKQSAELVCTNYILIECFALLQRRVGLEAARVFQSDVVGVLQVRWVDEALHAAGVAALLTAGRRQLSLVDCVSFELMRRLGLTTAFAFDQDFADQGFSCLT
jgi:predicted nucleic acid-binding protein